MANYLLAYHGGGEMPVWGDALFKSTAGGSDDAVKQLVGAIVDYVRTLQR